MTSREIERRLTRHDDIAALYELVTEVQQDVRALATRTDERFDAVDRRSDGIDGELRGVNRRFDGIEATLQLILERLPPSA